MYIQHADEIEDEEITNIIEKVLGRFGLEENRKEISREILVGLDDLFNEEYY